MSFERRVAVLYLARLLTGTTAPELEGRRITRIAFQQAPARPVDDLVIHAARDGETATSLELAVAVRRAPRFVSSDTRSKDLLTTFLRAIRGRQPREVAVNSRFAICVAGSQPASRQVAELAGVARDQQADSFFELIRTPGRFRKHVVARLNHLLNLIQVGLAALGEEPSAAEAERATWTLLSCLHVLMPSLEPPAETDWTGLLNDLEPWSRNKTLVTAGALRDRLESLAARYAPAAAVIEVSSLRRDAHDALNPDKRRNERGWAELARLDQDAREDVRTEIGGTQSGLHLARASEAEKLRNRIGSDVNLLVSGESGVGKSALVLSELLDAATAKPDRLQAVFLNLRRLPRSITGLRQALGCSVDDVLCEMSAPIRLLVIDAADFVIESGVEVLHHLMHAAKRNDVGVWAISALAAEGAVHSVFTDVFSQISKHDVASLDDTDLDKIGAAFSQLHNLLTERRSKELLRRPIVADLLVRSGTPGQILSEADAFEVIWKKLIRAEERTSRGLPDAREQVVCQLAMHQLRPEGSTVVFHSLDPAALTGLQRDGLLRSSSTKPWRLLPEFFHELLRTYAVSRVLLADGEPVSALLDAGAPRWALPAARLAAQVLFVAPDGPEVPRAGRLESIQADFDRLAAAGYGERWSDLPTEAALTLPESGVLLGGAWAKLSEGGARGFLRVLRVINQRHTHGGLVDYLVAEPVVELILLRRGWTYDHRGKDKSHTKVVSLVCDWLRALVVVNAPKGNPLREELRRQIVEAIRAADIRSEALEARRAAELTRRTPEQVREDERRRKELRSISMFHTGRLRRRRGARLPTELIDESTLEALALLGPDLGDEGAELLRRVAGNAPWYLAPSVEGFLAGRGLSLFRPSLLTELAEAYYLDDERDDPYELRFNYGIRDHWSRTSFGPLAAYYRGAFLTIFQTDFRNGVACLNKLLDHAARSRLAVLQSHPLGSDEPVGVSGYRSSLSITGEPRLYLGDSHVWRWYRGTGVGPYPCMSALQALEVVCDQLIDIGIPPPQLVDLLLKECENLAMPALVVGILVRHLDRIGDALDSFLTEPDIWYFEFQRVVAERSLFAAQPKGIHAPERRKWSFREVTTALVLSAEGDRIERLRVLGDRLVARMEELCGHEEVGDRTDEKEADAPAVEEAIVMARNWASGFDRNSYRVAEHQGGVVVQQIVPDDVRQALESSNEDLERGQEATALWLRYTKHRDTLARLPSIALADLRSDLVTARDLLSNPPAAAPGGPFAAPAAVAAGALQLWLLSGVPVPQEDLLWSAKMLVEVAKHCASAEVSDFEYSFYSIGADRSAACGLPLLFVPSSAEVRAELATAGVTHSDLVEAARWLVCSAPIETRVFYAKSMDATWKAPCNTSEANQCHHCHAVRLLEDSARSCIIGGWNSEKDQQTSERVDGLLEEVLPTIEGKRLVVPRISPAIRALGVAANTPSCCRERAEVLLGILLSAHWRGMAARGSGYFRSETDSLIAARALLLETTSGRESLLRAHVKHYIQSSRLLAELCRALAAVGEESPKLAEAARRVWPRLIEQVLDLIEAGYRPRQHGELASSDLAALMPSLAHAGSYLRRELEGDPIAWTDVLAWREQVERWLPLGAGDPRCVDSLVSLLRSLTAQEQASVGLAWVETLVTKDPGRIASGSWLLTEWLRELRPEVRSDEGLYSWQRIVDLLVVAGDTGTRDLAD